MKKVFLTSVATCTIIATILAQKQQPTDSLKQIKLNEVIVSSTRVLQGSPTAYSNLNQSEIKQNNTAQNIPSILQSLPSIVAYSEDGSGLGNTSLRIRGTDATRINVTLNGMPLNNPESQEVYWVNLPDLSNSLQSIQVQRGVGSSTNGSASFGASISLKTIGGKPKPYANASTAIGSYNTTTSTIAVGTGLIKNRLSLDARYSYIRGDGYIRNGKVNHKNLFTSLSYYQGNQLLRFTYINGIQHTGITWEGISPEQLKKDRKYNPAGMYYDNAGNIHYYDNETDNYYSNIFQLTYSNKLSNNLSISTGLSYNHGYGYYENYLMSKSFEDQFGLPAQTINGRTYEKSDIIRRKGMANDFYISNFTLDYSRSKLKLISGISYTIFNGDHFGKLKWIEYNQNIPTNYEWYRNNSDKEDFTAFSKINYQISKHISLFADLQYRHINYRMKGIDDDMENINNKQIFNFINPKTGISYKTNQHELYASFAVANREPLRSDIKESVKGNNTKIIKSERLFDYELGYKISSTHFSFNANFYYMHYKDQMVQTGKLNDVGYKLMENVPSSYRSGIELITAYKATKWIKMDANLTISSNKIKNYTAYYDVYDTDWNFREQTSEYLGKTDISFSPQIVGSSVFTITPYKTLNLSAQGKYVGKQYYNNTSNKGNRLPDYFVLNLVSNYSFHINSLAKLNFQFSISNLLNKRYVANAWVSSDKFTDGTQINYKGFYPQATRNIMFKAELQF